MTLIHLYNKGLTPFQQLLGYNEDIQSHWLQLGKAVEKDGHLSAHLKKRSEKHWHKKMVVSTVRQKVYQTLSITMRKQLFAQVLLKHS